jgi:hypothetical protein
MSAKVTADFINRMSKDHTLREEFKKDPEGVMHREHLPEESKAAFRHVQDIRKHLGPDTPPGCIIFFA